MSHSTSRDTIDDVAIARMSASEVESLLSELCVKLGFCLPPEARARIAANPPPNVTELTNTVFAAEGLDPSTADRHLYRQVRTLVAAAFRTGEVEPW